MKNKEQQAPAAYEAPKVEIIEVEVEKGFAASNGDISPYETVDGNGGWS